MTSTNPPSYPPPFVILVSCSRPQTSLITYLITSPWQLNPWLYPSVNEKCHEECVAMRHELILHIMFYFCRVKIYKVNILIIFRSSFFTLWKPTLALPAECIIEDQFWLKATNACWKLIFASIRTSLIIVSQTISNYFPSWRAIKISLSSLTPCLPAGRVKQTAN
jgi:hypothetical protein